MGSDTARLVAAALGTFRGQTVIAPGNHDPYTTRSAYARTLWPDNVHIFTEDRMQTIPFPQYGCAVHGGAFTMRRSWRIMYWPDSPPRTTGWCISACSTGS